MSVERNIAREARARAEYALMVRDGKRLPEPKGIALPLSRSVSTRQQWPLDVVRERDLPGWTEFECAEADVLAKQVIAAPQLDYTDRKILSAIVDGDADMTAVEIAAEADISRATLYRRLAVLKAVLTDLGVRETYCPEKRDTQ